MAEHEGLERVVRIEKKLDSLSVSVDERFNEVRDHFIEQREDIEFAYDRLDRRMSDSLAGLEQRMSERFAAVEQRMSDGFAALDQRITTAKEELTDGLSRMERKLDQFFESRSRSKVRRRPSPTKRRR